MSNAYAVPCYWIEGFSVHDETCIHYTVYSKLANDCTCPSAIYADDGNHYLVQPNGKIILPFVPTNEQLAISGGCPVVVYAHNASTNPVNSDVPGHVNNHPGFIVLQDTRVE